jgi:hypothetical protein
MTVTYGGGVTWVVSRPVDVEEPYLLFLPLAHTREVGAGAR